MDFSPASVRALTVAARWSQKLDVPLVVLNVVDTSAHLVATDRLPFTAPPSPADVDALVSGTEERLRAVAREHIGETDHTLQVVAEPDVAEGICQRLTNADLLVMATRSKAGLERVLMGSVAERTLRHASCPVMVVRGDAPAVPQRTLVCTDLTDQAQPALELGGDVCRAFGAKATVLHARAKPGIAVEQEVMASAKTDPGDIAAAIDGELKRLHEAFLPAPPQTAFAEGVSVADAIVEQAHQRDSDLILVATHAHTGLSRWLIGSVAEQVTRYAPCSVLVARAAMPATA